MDPVEQPAEKKVAPKKRGLLKGVLLLLFFVFFIIQFFPPDKNNSDMLAPNDITSMLEMSDTVQKIMKAACYDCHSNNTNYPWYTNIQPVGWWLENHIEEGKRHLNFSEFASIEPRNGKSKRERQLKKLEDIKEVIEEGEMPLTSYTWIHKDSRLTEEQKQLIVKWSDSAHKGLSQTPEK
jgi:hypothetical protein